MAAASTTEVFREEFQFGRAGRMVADDGLDYGIWVREFVPEAGLVDAISDGRAAFVASVTVGYVFGGKGEIVEAGFCRDFYATISCFS
jgi:hypothetical protein